MTRTRTRTLGFGLAAVMLATSAASIAVGTEVRPDEPVPQDRFTLIEPAGPAAALLPAGSPEPSVAPDAIGDFRPPERSFAPRPEPATAVGPRVVVVPTPTPRPTPRSITAPAAAASTVSGTASWYCQAGVSVCHYAYPGGMYAAAGPALRVGDWRGRTVRVCSGGACVNVTLIDWCQCYGSRVIDLYSDAFRRLAPLSAGTTRVTVSW